MSKIKSFHLALCSIIIILILFASCRNLNNQELLYRDGEGCGLPGADEIYPMLYFNSHKFYWKELTANSLYPGKYLPQEKEYIILGDIIFIGDNEPTEDLQFTAKFSASGIAYFYDEEPDLIYVYLMTDWFEEEYYVIFDRNFDRSFD